MEIYGVDQKYTIICKMTSITFPLKFKLFSMKLLFYCAGFIEFVNIIEMFTK